MPLYTLIADFEGGTYLSQYQTENLEQAVVLWAENFSIEVVPNVNEQFRSLLITEVHAQKAENVSPAPIEGMSCVWCSSFLPQDRFLLLNIVETATSDASSPSNL